VPTGCYHPTWAGRVGGHGPLQRRTLWVCEGFGVSPDTVIACLLLEDLPQSIGMLCSGIKIANSSSTIAALPNMRANNQFVVLAKAVAALRPWTTTPFLHCPFNSLEMACVSTMDRLPSEVLQIKTM